MTYKCEITTEHINSTIEYVNVEANSIEEAYEKLEDGDYFVMNVDEDNEDESITYNVIGVE